MKLISIFKEEDKNSKVFIVRRVFCNSKLGGPRID
jgi:hypothetical protein